MSLGTEYGPGTYSATIITNTTIQFLLVGGGAAGLPNTGGGGGAVVQTEVDFLMFGPIPKNTTIILTVGGPNQDTTITINVPSLRVLTQTAGAGQAGSGGIANATSGPGFFVFVAQNGADASMALVISSPLIGNINFPGGTPTPLGGGAGYGGPGTSVGQTTANIGAGGAGGLNTATNGGAGVAFVSGITLTPIQARNFELVVQPSSLTPSNNLVLAGKSVTVNFNAGDEIQFLLVGGGGNGGSQNPGDLSALGTGGGGGAVAFVDFGTAPSAGFITFTVGTGGNGFIAPNVGMPGSPTTATLTFTDSGVPVQTIFYLAGGGQGGNLLSGPPLTPATASKTTNGETFEIFSVATVNNMALNVPASANIFGIPIPNQPPAVAPAPVGIPASAGGAGYSTVVNGVTMDFGTGGYGVGYTPGNAPATAGTNGLVSYVIGNPNP